MRRRIKRTLASIRNLLTFIIPQDRSGAFRPIAIAARHNTREPLSVRYERHFSITGVHAAELVLRLAHGSGVAQCVFDLQHRIQKQARVLGLRYDDLIMKKGAPAASGRVESAANGSFTISGLPCLP
jgi:hypothetical protein